MQTFGPYQVVRELGRGGMGVVYEVSHPGSDRRLALKQILKDAASPSALLRFQRESELLARVQHTSVVRAHDGGRDSSGNPYLVTDLVEGQELADLLKRGALPAERAVPLARDLARALEAVHQAGCLHRDLKPANVIITPEGTPVLIDFGLAREAGDVERLTQTGTLLGTPNYMAPEQAEGISTRELDERVDVYGLGGVLFACLTGHPPFAGSGLLQLVKKVLIEQVRWPAEPKVDPALRRIVERALHKEPAGRYRTAAELADELERYLAGEVEAPPTSKLPWVGVGAVALCALAGLALFDLEPPEEPQAGPALSSISSSTVTGSPQRTGPPLKVYSWSNPRSIRLRPPRLGRAAPAYEGRVVARFLPDGRAVSLAATLGLVTVWDVRDDALQSVFRARVWEPKPWTYEGEPQEPRAPYARCLAVDPGEVDRFLVAGEEDHALIYTWDPATHTYLRKELKPAVEMEPAAVGLTFDLDAFSAVLDSVRGEALIGLREGVIVRFDLESGKEVGRLSHPSSTNPVSCLAISADGRTLATANGFNQGRGGLVGHSSSSDPGLFREAHYPLLFWTRSEEGWEYTKSTSREELVTNGAESLVFHPKREGVVAVGGRNGKVFIYDLAQGLQRTLVPHTGVHSTVGTVDLQFSPDGKCLFSVETNTQGGSLSKASAVRLWNVEDGETVPADLPSSERHHYSAFRIDSEGRFAILGRSGRYDRSTDSNREDASVLVFAVTGVD